MNLGSRSSSPIPLLPVSPVSVLVPVLSVFVPPSPFLRPRSSAAPFPLVFAPLVPVPPRFRFPRPRPRSPVLVPVHPLLVPVPVLHSL